jgi:hypothetical protein
MFGFGKKPHNDPPNPKLRLVLEFRHWLDVHPLAWSPMSGLFGSLGVRVTIPIDGATYALDLFSDDTITLTKTEGGSRQTYQQDSAEFAAWFDSVPEEILVGAIERYKARTPDT